MIASSNLVPKVLKLVTRFPNPKMRMHLRNLCILPWILLQPSWSLVQGQGHGPKWNIIQPMHKCIVYVCPIGYKLKTMMFHGCAKLYKIHVNLHVLNWLDKVHEYLFLCSDFKNEIWLFVHVHLHQVTFVTIIGDVIIWNHSSC